MGRELKVTLDEGEPLVGTLSRSDDQGIVLEWTTREPKPVGKGKHTVLHTQSIPYGDIRKACVVLNFNAVKKGKKQQYEYQTKSTGQNGQFGTDRFVTEFKEFKKIDRLTLTRHSGGGVPYRAEEKIRHR